MRSVSNSCPSTSKAFSSSACYPKTGSRFGRKSYIGHSDADDSANMAADLPLKLLLITFAGFVQRDQSRLIAYLLQENRVFRELQGNKRLRLSDDQRRRLAAKSKPLGRRLLDNVAAIVTPDTILRWHRRLISQHHTYPYKTRVGRPELMKSIRELISHGDGQRELRLPEDPRRDEEGRRRARARRGVH